MTLDVSMQSTAAPVCGYPEEGCFVGNPTFCLYMVVVGKHFTVWLIVV